MGVYRKKTHTDLYINFSSHRHPHNPLKRLLTETAPPPILKQTSEHNKYALQLGVKVVFKSRGTLWEALKKVKDTQSQLLRKDVVYKIPCNNCVRAYIGETGRNLKKRLMEHKPAVRREDTSNSVAVLGNRNTESTGRKPCVLHQDRILEEESLGSNRDPTTSRQHKPWLWTHTEPHMDSFLVYYRLFLTLGIHAQGLRQSYCVCVCLFVCYHANCYISRL